jgi:hypothetical protein
MKASTITERLHAKADADLKAKLEQSVSWVWDQIGYSTRTHPDIKDFPDVSSNYTNDGQPAPAKMPWIGRTLGLFKEVSFAYLRDKWRDQYVSDFMGKVEAMASEMENLGLVIQSQEQPQE